MKITWNENDIIAGQTVWIKSSAPTAWPFVSLTILRSEGTKKRDGTRRPDKWLLFNPQNHWATQIFSSRRAMARSLNSSKGIPGFISSGVMAELHASWERDTQPKPKADAPVRYVGKTTNEPATVSAKA